MNQKPQDLIDSFNNPDSILVISSYPERGVKYSGKVCAVGGFAKNTINSLSSHLSKQGKLGKFAVLTVTIDKEEIYEENGVLVWRVFERNNPLSYFNLFWAIAKFSRMKNVIVEFEFASYGGTFTTSLFPSVLFVLRCLGKNTVLVLHQVLENLKELRGHLGWKKTTLKAQTLSAGLRLFYWILAFLANQIVVLEEEFRKRLSKIIGTEEKIFLIPHGVDKGYKRISKKVARRRLGITKNEHLVLYFGYLTWYKGVDFLIKVFAKNKIKVDEKSAKLLIAGGESTTQKEKPHYQRFVSKVYSMAQKIDTVTITGFIDEKEIPLYFSASDLIVLPYRTFMSSSGPLSLAASFGKPFIISTALVQYLSSSDFSSSLQEAGLVQNDILFPLQEKEFISKITTLLNKKKLAKLAKFSKTLAKKRDFAVLASSYAGLLKSGQPKDLYVPGLSYLRALQLLPKPTIFKR